MNKFLPLAILCLLSGCASTHTLAVPACPKPAPLTPEMRTPAPPPGEFRKCLDQIIRYARGQGPISQGCSNFLQPAPTK